MQITDRLADTARWLRYAEEDLITAETLLRATTLAASSILLVRTTIC